MIEQRAQRGHQAPGREDDARRRREELVSTLHDGADGREPRNGKRGDILMISVDLAAIERLKAAVPLVLETGFDGRREAVWAEPWAPSGPAGAVAAAQRASQQPPPCPRPKLALKANHSKFGLFYYIAIWS